MSRAKGKDIHTHNCECVAILNMALDDKDGKIEILEAKITQMQIDHSRGAYTPFNEAERKFLKAQNQQLIDGIYATETIKDLELKFQAARNLLIIEKSLDENGVHKYLSESQIECIDQEIEAEVKRLKDK